MGTELVAFIALAGAVACWTALAAPDLAAAGHRLRLALRRWSRIERVGIDLAQADVHWISPWQWLALRCGLAAAAGIAAYLVFGLAAIGLVGALAAYHLTALALESRRRQVEARRQHALLDAVRFGVALMSRSGGALHMLRALAESGPIGAQNIFRQLLVDAGSEQAGQLIDSVERTRARLADPLFDDIALALTLHWTHGGRLAPSLEALVTSWDETLRLDREARALRAGIDASVWLLTVLPFVFLLLAHVLSPSLLDPLGQPVGEIALALAVSWMVIGHRVMQRLSEAPRDERLPREEVVP
jgi:tight adherence protein B